MVAVVSTLGLDEAESSVYVALLGHDALSVSELARKVRMHRASCYGVVDRLVEKGCVSVVGRNSVRTVAAVSPEVLLARLRESVTAFERAVPSLTSLWEQAQRAQHARMYRGVEGIRYVQGRVLLAGQPLSICGDGDAFASAFPTWAKRLSAERKRKHIPTRILLRGSEDAIRAVKRMRARKEGKVRARVVPEAYALVGGFDVTGETVALYSFEHEPIVVVITDETIATLVQTVFDMLWDIAETYDRTLLR